MLAEKIRRLEEFLSINGLNCTIKQYSNEEFTASNEMYDYLENGDVDLLLGNSAENDSRYRVVATFDAQPYYLVTVPGSTEILDSIRQGHVNYVISTRDIDIASQKTDGYKIRRCAVENSVTMFTALDTVKILLDVLEETTMCVSTIDAE